ncbi:hypothetical protein [Lachnoclostridium sp. Marseille-P6806]|nr:hypothetical protein [Lachnoclostridium sp. Marseille-P6806]
MNNTTDLFISMSITTTLLNNKNDESFYTYIVDEKERNENISRTYSYSLL